MSKFQKATRKKSKARVALIGPSGSGKTFTALTIARALLAPGERMVLFDTERGSASKYAGDAFDFDVLELETFSPEKYVEALNDAKGENYPVVVIDSLSHAWVGKDGALEQVDRAAAKGGNSYTSWRGVTPKHNALVDAILRYPGHVVVTMRAKTEYVMEADPRGKMVPRKVGLAPVQRDGMEYEFDVVADIDLDHRMVVTKSRCPALADQVIERPGPKVGETLLAWLDDGVDAPQRPGATPYAAPEEPTIAGAPIVVFDQATANEQAQRRMEADQIASEWIPLLEKIETAKALETWIWNNGAWYRGLHANAKGRIKTVIKNVGERVGIELKDIGKMIAEAKEFPEDESEEVAQ